MEPFIEILDEGEIPEKELFPDYHEWKKKQDTTAVIPGFSREQFAKECFALSKQAQEKEEAYCHNPESWKARNILALLAQSMPKDILVSSSCKYTQYPQQGIKCIAENIASSLNPYGIDIDYNELYTHQLQHAQSQNLTPNNLINYKAVLEEYYGVSSEFVDSPTDLLGYVICGYPVVLNHHQEWHAYTITGCEYDSSSGVIYLIMKSTSPYPVKKLRIDEVPYQFDIRAFLVLNPNTYKQKPVELPLAQQREPLVEIIEDQLTDESPLIELLDEEDSEIIGSENVSDYFKSFGKTSYRLTERSIASQWVNEEHAKKALALFINPDKDGINPNSDISSGIEGINIIEKLSKNVLGYNHIFDKNNIKKFHFNVLKLHNNQVLVTISW